MKKKQKTQVVTIKTNEENPEPLELIAKSIIEVAAAFKKIEASPLRRKTVVLLLQDATGLNQTQIGKILDAAPQLEHYYLK